MRQTVGRADPAVARRLAELELRPCGWMKERLARLAPDVGVPEFGGFGEVEVNERRDRVSDALSVARAAVARAPLRSAALSGVQPSNDDQKISAEIARRAASAAADDRRRRRRGRPSLLRQGRRPRTVQCPRTPRRTPCPEAWAVWTA